MRDSLLCVSGLRQSVAISWKIVELVAIVLLAGCKSDPVWTTSSLVSEVRLISDSPDVRLLISEQEKSDAAELHWLRESRTHEERVRGVEDRRRHPERYAPTLRSFIDAMAAMPGFAVRGGDSCRLVERSQARCTPDRLDTFSYVKVRIIQGYNRGQEGWACEVRDVSPTTAFFRNAVALDLFSSRRPASGGPLGRSDRRIESRRVLRERGSWTVPSQLIHIVEERYVGS